MVDVPKIGCLQGMQTKAGARLPGFGFRGFSSDVELNALQPVVVQLYNMYGNGVR